MEADIFLCTTAPVMYSLCSAKADAIFGALQSCLGAGTAGHSCALTPGLMQTETVSERRFSEQIFQIHSCILIANPEIVTH